MISFIIVVIVRVLYKLVSVEYIKKEVIVVVGFIVVLIWGLGRIYVLM